MLWQLHLHWPSVFICIISACALPLHASKLVALVIGYLYDTGRMSHYYYLVVFLNDTSNWNLYNGSNSTVTWPCGKSWGRVSVVGLTWWLRVVLMSRVITSCLFALFSELKINSAENWSHFVLINYHSAKPAPPCIWLALSTRPWPLITAYSFF